MTQNTHERRPIPAAPDHYIDRVGQVYQLKGGHAVRIPSDSSGRFTFHVGRSCRVMNRRDILSVVWPDEVHMEESVARLDKIEGDHAEDRPRRKRRRRRDTVE